MSNVVSFQEMDQMASAIAQSGLFGMKDKASVLALMAVAQAEGLHPATAARDFHIIQGRPALKADAMLARFQNAGGSVQWKDYTDEKVTGTFKHPNGGELDVTWTIEQAIKIGLVKPGSGWQKFPRAMLRSRCISEGIRSVFPGSVTGFYSPEEVADFTPVEKDVTPAVNSISQSASLSKGAFDDMKDDLPFEAPATTGQFALRVPNQDTPYDFFDTKDQWIDGFVDIVRKIYDSSKYTPEEKQAKYEALREVNLMFIKGFDPQTSVKFTRLTSIIRKADHE
jgi:hypothetical protein